MTSQTNKPSTPPTLSNNYAAPHTPIASIKRPRNKKEIDLSPLHPPRAVFREESDNTTTTPEVSPASNGSSANSTSHNLQQIDEDISWVNSTQRKVNALFSPVLHFLNGKDETDGDENDIEAVDGGGGTTTVVNGDVEKDNDISMEDIAPPVPDPDTPTSNTQPTSLCSTTNSTMNTHTNSVDNASLDDGDYISDDDYQAIDSVDDESFDDAESTEFNPYLFIKHLPAYNSVAIRYPTPALPPKSPSEPPVSLVLDLDETLVHCTVEPTPDADLVFPVTFNGISYSVHVKKRPHLERFLQAVHRKFEVVVFTASQRVYADELLDRIDPKRQYIRHRLFRDSCLPVEGNFLKDLNVLGRCLTKTVLVDNSPHAFGYQVDNGVPIESWFDDPHDTELLKLEKFLMELEGVEDVREVVRRRFETRKLINQA